MAPGDIIACTILGVATHNGWVADITIEGWAGKAGTIAYDYGLVAGTPDNRIADHIGPVFTVVSEGYDAAATLGTISRTVRGVSTIRKAYPNHAQLDERDSGTYLVVRVELDEFVYNDDRNGGAGTSGTDPTVSIPVGWANDGANDSAAVAGLACTNGSTLDYPKPVCRWAWPGYTIVDAAFLLEAVCYHRFARNHKPVACVKFDAADQSAHSAAQQTVTAESLSTRTHASGLKLPVYAATMPVTGLNDEVIDCRVRAYPWVGDADSVFDSAAGTAQPDERYGPLHLVNNAGGTYGLAYAAVDGVGGAPAVAATEASARTTPYATIDAAIVALKAYITANYGRASCDGGIVVCEAGSYAAAGSGAGTMANSHAFTIIRPATGVSGSAVTITGNGNTSNSGWVKYEGVQVADSGATGAFRGSTTAGIIWFDACPSMNLTGTAPIWTWKACYGTNNTVIRKAGGFRAFSTTRSPWALFRGNDCSAMPTGDGQTTFYCNLANIGPVINLISEATDTAGHQLSEDAISAFNYAATINGARFISGYGDVASDIAHGIALVGNVVEVINPAAQPIFTISADGSLGDTNHVIVWHNTIAGERANLGYNETGLVATPHMNWSERFNSYEDWNNKGDVFATDGNLTGNWPVQNQVGGIGNHHASDIFPPEFDGLEFDTGSPLYVNDLSGAGGGGGDYTPDAGSPLLNRFPGALYAPIAYDLFGTAIQSNGDTGAIQVTAPAAGGGGSGLLHRGLQMTALSAGGTPGAGFVFGTPRCFVEDVALSGQSIADTIEICRLPKGAVLLYGGIIADAALGASTTAVGVPAYPDKYRAADVLAVADRPELFGLAAGIGATLAEEETVILTVGGAAFPTSGRLRVAIFYAFD